MEGINWAQLLRVFTSEVSDMIKVCQWRGENCMDADLWTAKVTRVGQCWELDVPMREVTFSTESLRLVIG